MVSDNWRANEGCCHVVMAAVLYVYFPVNIHIARCMTRYYASHDSHACMYVCML